VSKARAAPTGPPAPATVGPGAPATVGPGAPGGAPSPPAAHRPAGRPADDAARQTAERLHSAAIHLLRRLRREDVASGLTGPRVSALSVIVYAGPLTLSALAAAEQVRPPTMSRIVAALVAEGLATREPDERDGRVVLIRATPAGERLLTAARSRRTGALSRRLAALPAEELRLLARAAELIDDLARRPG
jgi:DNA-binding MarR family transcriptional regulator